jgi:hypothetical protein
MECATLHFVPGARALTEMGMALKSLVAEKATRNGPIAQDFSFSFFVDVRQV